MYCQRNDPSKPSPPFSPPDCPWITMSSTSKLPDNVFYENGKLDKEKTYVARVCYNGNFYIGTAIPSKGICLFEVDDSIQETQSYEILTIDCGNPLEFHHVAADHDKECYSCDRLKFVGGLLGEDEILYIGRHKADGNIYYGWIQEATKTLHIPRDSKSGPSKIVGDYELLLHKYLDRLCICPCPPPESVFH